MSVFSEFYVDGSMTGSAETFTLPDGYRYQWIKFGGALANRISSLRGSVSGGPAHVYGFNDNNFLGKYAALHLQDNTVAWYSSLGSERDDNIESAIVVARNPARELVLDLGGQIRPEFIKQFDAKAAGTGVSRTADPRIFTLFWPGHDPGKIFVRIEQDLNVDPPGWPWDYAARVTYDVVVYRTAEGRIDAYANWTHTWVEGGVISGSVLDALHPKMVEGSYALTQALRDKLASFGAFKFSDAYLLPGPKPSSNYAEWRDASDGSSLVLVF